MTQLEAADLSDLAEKTLRSIESGKVAPGLAALVPLAETLGFDVSLTPRNTRASLPAGTVVIRREGGLGD